MTRTKVEKHFDKVAGSYDSGKNKYSFYYNNLKKLLASLIPINSKVYEIGCGTGDLLASLKPKKGVGYDISPKMINLAKRKYSKDKNLYFSTKPLSTISNQLSTINYIFMSDVIEHLDNPQKEFSQIAKLMGKKTHFIITMANPIWEPLLMLWEKLGWKMKEGPHKRITFKDLRIVLKESGMKIIRHNYKLLIPIEIPILTEFVNANLEKYLKKLCFIEYLVVKKI